jgi:hypothetical protein
MLVSYHNTTRHHNPEDLNKNLYHHENLKSLKLYLVLEIELYELYCFQQR